MRPAFQRLLVVFVLTFLPAAIPLGAWRVRPPILRPFELQGDIWGESFALFMAHHPRALCQDSTKARKECYQWEDVSIFGLSARPDSDCTPARHASPGCAQGLTAQFAEGRLIMLAYEVLGKDKTPAVEYLTKKYGTPITATTDGTIWSSGNRTLSVVVEKVGGRGQVETVITFTMQGMEVAMPSHP